MKKLTHTFVELDGRTHFFLVLQIEDGDLSAAVYACLGGLTVLFLI